MFDAYRLLTLVTLSCIMQASPLAATIGNGALVLYDEDVLPPHHKPHQFFEFGDSKISIRQTWTEDGVAGVVWEAVGLY